MVDDILRRVSDALTGNNRGDRDVRPASEDPYGDPAEQSEFGNVRPASEDPYGDPADSSDPQFQNQGFGNVRPASEDPYGDPADQG